jgi:hypothetical protein
MAYRAKYTPQYRKRRQVAAAAVRSYNAAVTRIEKQFGKSYAPPRRSVEELMKNFPTMKALRSEIKEMKKIPSPKNLEFLRIKGVITSTYAVSETARLNQRRNEKREQRRKKYEPLVKGRAGWTAKEEKALHAYQPFDENRFNDPKQWARFKYSLMVDLSKERNIDSYFENYLSVVEEELGTKYQSLVRQALGDLSAAEFYQLALTEDFRDVFTIEYIKYFELAPEQKMEELLWALSEVKEYI